MANVESSTCSQCGAPVNVSDAVCRFCGVSIEPAKSIQGNSEMRPYAMGHQGNITVQFNQPQFQQPVAPTYRTTKNKTAAGILAILFGSLGVHKFYLGKPIQGIIYLLFCWTYIPGLLGIIDGIILLVSSDEKFAEKYGKLE